MNHDQLIKGTNRVAIYATVALFYWVFVFLIITTFDLKIFKEHITEIFYLSLLGIFAILGGALILNVMSNLSKISTVLSVERGNNAPIQKPSRFAIIALALSFPLICGVLFAGNSFSAEKKKYLLVSAAQSLIAENNGELATIANYQFSIDYVKKAEQTLGIIRKIDKNFPEVMLIVPDKIDDKKVFLGFGGNLDSDDVVTANKPDQINRFKKPRFIYSATREEREYLDKVFSGNESNYKFSYEKGNYQLYFPALINGKKIVLYFSDYQRYGKFGS
ncbi:MAG: hypothetical protein PHD01_18070 [Geobacteraceae bacterium]|nr:hypothetical protein [Geobacteraceae bacterium]